MPTTQQAEVVWVPPLAVSSPKPWYRIGTLSRRGDGALFAYTSDQEFDDARALGFDLYPGLPLEREVRERDFDLFLQRLPFTRADFSLHMGRLGLSEAALESDPLSILTFTGARVLRDNFGLFDTFVGVDRPATYIFEIASFTDRFDEVAARLEANMPLALVDQLQNTNAPSSINVKMLDGTVLGHIPPRQSPVLATWMRAGGYTATLHRMNGWPLRPRAFVWVDFHPPKE